MNLKIASKQGVATLIIVTIVGCLISMLNNGIRINLEKSKKTKQNSRKKQNKHCDIPRYGKMTGTVPLSSFIFISKQAIL